MSSNFKLDAAKGHDSEDLEVGSINGGVHSILPERRAVTLTDRLFKGSRGGHGEIISIPIGGDEKHEHRSTRKSGPLLSGTAYCISSCKLSTIIVVLLGFSGVLTVEKLNWKLVRVWIPVNVIFIGMLASGMYSTWRIILVPETSESESVNCHVYDVKFERVLSLPYVLQIISSISSGITDISFGTVGYAWLLSNCVQTASYSLTLRRVMDEEKKYTRSESLNEVSMVVLNNLVSLPFAAFLIILFDEWEYIMNVDVIKLPMFWVVATASGLLGLAISFTSMWFLHQTGPTMYSLVGSLNKSPISLAGLVLFKVPLSLPNLFSILFGLFAGIFFARAIMS